MSTIGALAPIVSGSLDPATRGWLDRLPIVPRWGYVSIVDRFIREGKRDGWWNYVDDFLVMGFGDPELDLEGLKGVVTFAGCTIFGDINFIPFFGPVAAEDEENAYVNLGLAIQDLPSFSLSSFGLGVFCSTNLAGLWTELGATGTAGKHSIGVRCSGGFRGGFYPGSAGQLLFGDSAAWGWHAGARVGANLAITWENNELPLEHASPVGDPSTANITLLSSEPGASNSPNQVLMAALLGAMPAGPGQLLGQATLRMAQRLNVLSDIETPPYVMGPNCFGPQAVDTITNPDTMIGHVVAPPTASSTQSTYNYYPITISWSRPWQTANPIRTLAEDPIEVFMATPDRVRFNDPLSTARLDDTVVIAGATGSAGNLDTSLLNGRHRVIDSGPGWFEIEFTGTWSEDATSGGTAVQCSYRCHNVFSTDFMTSRGAHHLMFVWDNKGPNQNGPDGKPNDTHSPITRVNAGDSTPAGIACRPWYTTPRLAAGATAATWAYMAGHAERDDPDDPNGFGYLDYAEHYGIDAANVQPWWWFYVNADDVFIHARTGFAVSHDYVVLPPRNITNLDLHPDTEIGIGLDFEAADNRTPELRLELMTHLGEIAACKGLLAAFSCHPMTGKHAITNGMTPAVANAILNDPNWRWMNIYASEKPAEGQTTLENAENQYEHYRNGQLVSELPVHKFLLQIPYGAPKQTINDGQPYGQNQMRPETAASLREWAATKGIFNFMVVRIGQREGGEIERVPNQVLLNLLEGLSDQPPPPPASPALILAAWNSAVVGAGGAPSETRKANILSFLTDLESVELLAKLRHISLYAGEDLQSALVDIRNQSIATLGGAPSFVSSQHIEVDGTDDYINTNWAPSSDPVMDGASQMLAFYVKDVASGGTRYCAGTLNGGSAGMRLNPRTLTTRMQGQAGSTNTAVDGVTLPASGFFGIQKKDNALTYWANGVLYGTAGVGTNSDVLAINPLFAGCFNNNGTPSGFQAAKHVMLIAGVGLTADEWVSLNAIVGVLLEAIASE